MDPSSGWGSALATVRLLLNAAAERSAPPTANPNKVTPLCDCGAGADAADDDELLPPLLELPLLELPLLELPLLELPLEPLLKSLLEISDDDELLG